MDHRWLTQLKHHHLHCFPQSGWVLHGWPVGFDIGQHYSYRDRIRYYWNEPEVRAAVEQLTRNFEKPVPMALIRQYLPDLVSEMEAGTLKGNAPAIIHHRLRNTVKHYLEPSRPYSGTSAEQETGT